VAHFWDEDVAKMDAFSEPAVWDDGQRCHNIQLTAYNATWLASEFVETDVDNLEPAAFAPSSSVATAAIGHTLTVDSILYQIVGVEPDGNGLTRLRLSKDA
jgi:hypothetical protein